VMISSPDDITDKQGVDQTMVPLLRRTRLFQQALKKLDKPFACI
jgi:hypothetical protein